VLVLLEEERSEAALNVLRAAGSPPGFNPMMARRDRRMAL
jgi:hypothetical protein